LKGGILNDGGIETYHQPWVPVTKRDGVITRSGREEGGAVGKRGREKRL